MDRASSSASASGPGLILLAEDDASLRELIADALGIDGHRVVQVATGGALISAVNRILVCGEHEGRLDLVISDVRMPEVTGIEALRVLRDAELGVPIILITAFSDLWTRKEAARYGARLIDKPLELRVLRHAVQEELTHAKN
ncbi:MAG: response regulator [Polyangiaceae bacterium]